MIYKTIGLRNLCHCICNTMPFIVTFVMYQKVLLLPNDIVVVAAKGNEWEVRTTQRSFPPQKFMRSPYEGSHEQQTRAGDQKLIWSGLSMKVYKLLHGLLHYFAVPQLGERY